MVTKLLKKIGNQPITYETVITAGAGQKILFFPVHPDQLTSIQVKKDGETATVDITTVTRDTTAVAATVGAGQAVTDLELAQFSNVSSGTADYIGNKDSHISCIKIDSTPVTNDVIITIQQHKIPG